MNIKNKYSNEAQILGEHKKCNNTFDEVDIILHDYHKEEVKPAFEELHMLKEGKHCVDPQTIKNLLCQIRGHEKVSCGICFKKHRDLIIYWLDTLENEPE